MILIYDNFWMFQLIKPRRLLRGTNVPQYFGRMPISRFLKIFLFLNEKTWGLFKVTIQEFMKNLVT